MVINKYEDVGEIGKDILKEIGSIGTGNAATSLSNLLGVNVSITVPDVRILTFAQAMYAVGNPEEEVVAVMTRMSEGMEGVMLFIFRSDFANTLCTSMMGKGIETYADIDEIAHSALTEAGNIVISSYLGSLSTFINEEISLSVPASAVNMLGGILNVPMAEIGHETNKLMMISGKFIVDNAHLEGCLLMVPTLKSLKLLLEKLGGIGE